MRLPLQNNIIISAARKPDLPAITDIYNHAIGHTTATFDTQKKSVDEMSIWFDCHSETHPILIAKSESIVAGWAALSPWSDRCAYSRTVEDSVYVSHRYRRQGIGTLLLENLLEIANKNRTHTIIARVTTGNPGSMNLHLNAGFTVVGIMREVGYKFNRLHDVAIMQIIL